MMHLSGQPVADRILARVREGVAGCARIPHPPLTEGFTPRVSPGAAAGKALQPPHLVIVHATDREESATYVARKEAAARDVGMRVTVDGVSADARTTAALIARVQAWSGDADVDGIIVQLPLPEGVDAHAVLEAVHPAKDVDGLTSASVAAAYLGTPGFRAATAAACIAILDDYAIPIVGARATIVGRSRLVGLPLAGMLLRRDATVTVAHTRTADLAAACRSAEILIVASGRPATVTRDMVSPGATVVDVGWQRVGGAVVGDVAPDVATVAGALTPVPGGVGPVTVAQLLANTLEAARMR